MVKWMQYEKIGGTMERNKVNIRGIMFDNITPDESEAYIEDMLSFEGASAVYTPNAEIAQACIEDASLCEMINSGELILPDGVGVIKAARILGTPLKGKVAGVDFGERTLKIAARDGKRVFFLGGKPGVAEEAAKKMCEKYEGLIICGTNDGYFKKSGEETDAVVKKINEAAPDVLFVCLGFPVQEKWIYENKSRFESVKMCLALGGSLDVYAGNVKRAPKIFIKLGLEWFYRLLCQPSRLGRMMKLPKYLFGTYFYKFKRKNK